LPNFPVFWEKEKGGGRLNRPLSVFRGKRKRLMEKKKERPNGRSEVRPLHLTIVWPSSPGAGTGMLEGLRGRRLPVAREGRQ